MNTIIEGTCILFIYVKCAVINIVYKLYYTMINYYKYYYYYSSIVLLEFLILVNIFVSYCPACKDLVPDLSLYQYMLSMCTHGMTWAFCKFCPIK